MRVTRQSHLLVRGSLALLVVAVFTWMLGSVNWSHASSLLRKEFLFAILAVQPLILCSLVLQAWRHGICLGNSRPPFRPLVEAFLLSAALNNVLPARSGELVKASYLHAQCGIPVGVGLAAVVIERVLDVLMLAALALAGMMVITMQTPGLLVLALLVPLILLSAAALLPRIDRIQAASAAWLTRRRWTVVADTVLPMMRHFGRDISGGMVTKACLVTVSIWVAGAFSYVGFIEIAAGGVLTPAAYLTLVVAAVVGIAVPILPNGLVTFESAVIFVLSTHGYTMSDAFSLAVGLRLCLWVAIMPAALGVLLRRGTGLMSVFLSWRSAVSKGPAS